MALIASNTIADSVESLNAASYIPTSSDERNIPRMILSVQPKIKNIEPVNIIGIDSLSI